MASDMEIARAHKLRPISEIAAKLGLSEAEIILYGRHKAKVPLELISRQGDRHGKLILVTGIHPTAAGEGKSTVSVGLADALALRDKKAVLALREPSLGPVFGIKGGATGGGYSQVVPMEDINLHFTGDFHAVTSANGLLAAMVDNHLHRPNSLHLDPRRVTWRRAVDMNDRALRKIIVGLGGGHPREDEFQITAASEVMAILALAISLEDLEERLGDIIVGYSRDLAPVRARELRAEGAMTLLLRDALAPNLVQTLGGTPAFIHAGPFGNIAHGCNSLIATKAGLALGDYVVTEAGFGADLGGEKFFDIKCRAGGLKPDAAVVVGTIRALKMQGGVPTRDLLREDVDALKRGLENIVAHIENVKKFGVPPVVALNRFTQDTKTEIETFVNEIEALKVPVAVVDPWGGGGEGVLDLADAVLAEIEKGKAAFKPLYPLEMGLKEKVEIIATKIYGADGVDFDAKAAADLDRLEEIGLRNVPVCMSKTQYSFSDDPTKLGRPKDFRIRVREVTPSSGAGFVVVRTGEVMTMPGLAAVPGAEGMRVMSDGTILGLA